MHLDGYIAKERRALGRRISLLRQERGLSQYRFSAMVGINRSYLIDVEKGRRNVSVDNLIRIAQGLGIPLSELTKGVDREYEGS